MAEPQRTEELVAAAKAEGAINVYGLTSTTKFFTDDFEKRYGIKVNLFAGDNEEVFQRFEQEYKAGRHEVDVLWTAAHFFGALPDGALGDYESDLRKSLDEGAYGDGWTGTGPQNFVVGYNTDLVDPSSLPDTIEGFTDSKWKGKLGMEVGDFDWLAGLYGYYTTEKGMSEDEFVDMMERIASNAVVLKGHTAMATLMASGGVQVILNGFISSIKALSEKGAPIAWGGTGSDLPTVEPIVLRYTGAAVLAEAPHPAAAQLFVDYLLSEDSLPIYQESGELPPDMDNVAEFKGLNTVILDSDQFAQDQEKFSTMYDKILRKAAKSAG